MSDLAALDRAFDAAWSRRRGPLWPAEFSDDVEGALRFLGVLRTWNEAESEVQPFPVHLSYVRDIVAAYYWCRGRGKPLVIEKCRRMVVSWLFRGLELHLMGLRRADVAIVDRRYASAARHIWRLQHYYEDLAERFPAWRLEPLSAIREQGDRQLRSLSFPNGSTASAINSEEGSFPGSGYSYVMMEELSRYPRPDSIWAQASIVAAGSAGKSGVVVAVTNAYPSPSWWKIKDDPRAKSRA